MVNCLCLFDNPQLRNTSRHIQATDISTQTYKCMVQCKNPVPLFGVWYENGKTGVIIVGGMNF